MNVKWTQVFMSLAIVVFGNLPLVYSRPSCTGFEWGRLANFLCLDVEVEVELCFYCNKCVAIMKINLWAIAPCIQTLVKISSGPPDTDTRWRWSRHLFLDSDNALYYSITDDLMRHLQSIQNAAVLVSDEHSLIWLHLASSLAAALASSMAVLWVRVDNVNVSVNVSWYNVALSHSASHSRGALIIAETDASSVGDWSWRCWDLDHADRCRLSSRQLDQPQGTQSYVLSCICGTASREVGEGAVVPQLGRPVCTARADSLALNCEDTYAPSYRACTWPYLRHFELVQLRMTELSQTRSYFLVISLHFDRH